MLISWYCCQGQNAVSCDYLKDSIDITPDTIYLTEGEDSIATIDFMNNSHVDLSYAFLWVVFDDTTYIDIKDTTVTGGLQSPYPFPHTWDANIEYKTQPIPPNSIVYARFNVWNGNIDTPVFDGCELPLVFVINSEATSILETGNVQKIPEISPNPLVDRSIIKLDRYREGTYRIIIIDLLGRTVFDSQYFKEMEYLIDRKMFDAAGTYFLVVLQDGGRMVNAIKLVVE